LQVFIPDGPEWPVLHFYLSIYPSGSDGCRIYCFSAFRF
jgi:hypothetical protein